MITIRQQEQPELRNIMTTSLPLIGIQADVIRQGEAPFHAVGEKYINAVAHGGPALPVLLPGRGAGLELAPLDGSHPLDAWLDRLDGLFLPGSPSNIEPHHYQGSPSLPGTQHDPQRDASSLALIRAARQRGMPVLAVCRGFQELNVALGGTLHQRVHEVSGYQDHREDKDAPRAQQYRPAHSIHLSLGGWFSQWLDGAEQWQVNSLHAQGIDRLADDLIVEARAHDGLIEAVRLNDANQFMVGVQWHPEWQWQDDALSRALFARFAEAARAYRARGGPT